MKPCPATLQTEQIRLVPVRPEPAAGAGLLGRC